MTAGLKASVANAILDALRDGGASLTVVDDTFVQLHTGDPGANGTANVSVGDTVRDNFDQTAPAAGAMGLTGSNPTFTNGGTSETITHISVWDAVSGGNFLYSVALAASKAWTSGQTLTITTLAAAITPLAA